MRNVNLLLFKANVLNFLFISIFFSLTSLYAQTNLIDPAGDGGFETGATFAANNWTAVNTATANGSQWFITSGTITNGAYSFVPTTSRAAYVSNNAGTNWRYNTSGAASSSHIYKDITFPATQTNINLSFRYNVNGNDVGWDEMYVYLCPQTLTPVANSPSSNTTTVSWTGTGTATLLGTFRNLTAGTGANSGSIIIPSAIAGNTVSSSNMRLVFTWKNDGSGGTEPPAALDDVSLTSATPVPFSGTRTVGPTGNYFTLGAAFVDLAANGVNGAVTLELQSTYLSNVETFPVTASAIPGSSGTNTITVRPAAGATGLSITSANTTATLRLSGGSNIIFDGRPGGTGDLATTNLSIANTSTTTGGTAIQFLNDASSNTIQYANLSAAFSSTSSGVLNFLGTTGTTGNDNNTITLNNINGSGTAANGIYAAGNTANAPAHNSGNTISNNNIYDFYTAGSGTNAIQISTGNSGFTISGNRIYQTATRNFTSGSSHTAILISNNSGFTADQYIISGNIIGGTGAALTAGPTPFSPYTMTHSSATSRYRAINVSLGSGYTASIQGNTIAGFAFGSSTGASTVGGPWCGMYLNNGIFNVGNITGNTIGAATGTGSIVATTTSTGGISSGIFVDAASTLNISNNTIGSVNTLCSTTSNSHGFTGIRINVATTATVNNNTIGSTSTSSSINAGTASTSTTAQVLTGIRNESSANITISGNTIANFANAYVPTSTTSNLMMGIINSAGVATISQNTIRNLSVGANATGTTLAVSVIGISMTSTTAGQTVSQNTIHSLSNTNSGANATGVIGIHYNGPTSGTNLVARNQIYSLTTNGTSASGFNYGINVSGGSTTYQNNMITMGNGASNGIDIRGVNDLTGTNNYYFNSIYIGGSPSANTANTFAFVSAVTSNTRAFQNNVFVNARTNSGAGRSYAIQVAGTGPNPGGLTINYNDYWVSGTGTVLGRFNAGDVSTIAAWRMAVGQDVNSFKSDPLYAGPTSSTPDLKLTTGSPCEGTGLLIALVTDDFEGQNRAGLTPTDIGADAGDYAAIGLDVGVTALVSPASSGCFTATETVTVTIRNNSASLIDFSLNPVTVTVTATGGYSSMLVLNTGTLAGTTTQNVNMPATIDLTVNGAYTFNANATVVGDINTGNDAMSPVVQTVLSLGGTKTVGAGGDYATLTAAVAAYNSASCFTSNVVFSLTEVSYSGSETFPISINANAAAGSNTLTIKPQNPLTSISGGSASGLILINGADYVTIDGSSGSTANTVCPPSAASRDLTITNTNISPTSAVVWLQTVGADGATNNKVINCNLIGSGNTQTLFGVGSGSSTITTSSLGTGNNNNQFVNNNISKTQYGIFSQGASAANKNTGTVVSQNLINTVSPNNVAKGGIMTGFENGITISGNSISGISVSGDAFGISLGTSSFSTSSLTGNEVINAVIDKNNIGTIIGSGTNSAAGIILVTAASGTNLISNNMIYGVTSNGTSGDFAAGIIIGGGAGSTNIFYNTVSMVGDRGSTSSSLYPSYALAIGGSNPSVNVNNNILYNTQTSTGSASANLKSYAIALGYGAPFTALVSDRNDLYTSGVVSGFGLYGSLVPTSGTSVANLIAWQGTPGKDANSLSIEPVFTSSTDLHLVDSNPANIPLNSSAITVSVTDDIDCGTRDGSTPDMGADEFTPPVCAGAIAGTASALPTGPFCGSGSSVISASGYSFGTGSTYQWQSSVDVGFTTPVNIGSPSNSYANLNTGNITDTTFFRLKVTCTSGMAEDFTASPVQIVINPSLASISGLSLKCPTDPAITLTENGGTGTSWLWSTTETTSSISVNPVSTTTYTVTVTSPGACITSSTKIITVNPLPSITAVGVTPNPVCAGSALNLTSSASPGVLGYSTGSTTFAPIASGSGNVTLATAGSASTALTSGNLDDGYWNALALPFSFTYFGTPYATINVQTNGIVSFTAFSTSTGYNSSPQMPNTAAPNNILGVFGDQDWTLGGVISTYTSGVAPNRIFVINYNGSTGGGWYNSGSLPTALVNYQIQLFENGNKIQIHSTSIPTFSSLVRTMGIENSGGTAGLVISGRNNSTWTITNDAVEFTPTFVNYSWTGPNTFTSSLQNPTIASAGPSGGIYTVQVTDNNGCTASSSTINVTVNALPTATISFAGNPYCKTGMTIVTQTGQGGGSYASAGGLSINTGTGEVDLGASTSGAYTVTYSFTDGTCPNTTTAPVQIEGTVVKSTADSGFNSFRNVFECITEGGTITYDQPTTVTTILTSTLDITKSVTIEGLSIDARPEITLPAVGMDINAGKVLSLKNVDIKYTGTNTFTGTGEVIIIGDEILGAKSIIKQ